MFIAAASVGGSPIATTVYGGLRVCPSISSAPGAADHPGIDPDPHRDLRVTCAALDLHRLGAGVAQFVDHIEHGFRRDPWCGVLDGQRHPGTRGGHRADQDRQCRQPGLGILDGGLVAAARRLKRRQRLLQVGDLGVQRGLPLLQRIQQHQQVGRPRGFQRVAGLVLPDLGDDRDARAGRRAVRQAPRTRAGLRPRRSTPERLRAAGRRSAVRGSSGGSS